MNDITDEQYKQFYQHISHDHDDTLAWTHNRMEGRSELKLYVKGVVDSADLPLNVSREILQESRDVKAIREGVTKRVL